MVLSQPPSKCSIALIMKQKPGEIACTNSITCVDTYISIHRIYLWLSANALGVTIAKSSICFSAHYIACE